MREEWEGMRKEEKREREKGRGENKGCGVDEVYLCLYCLPSDCLPNDDNRGKGAKVHGVPLLYCFVRV